MEEGEGSMDRIIVIAETVDEQAKKKIPSAPPLPAGIQGPI